MNYNERNKGDDYANIGQSLNLGDNGVMPRSKTKEENEKNSQCFIIQNLIYYNAVVQITRN